MYICVCVRERSRGGEERGDDGIPNINKSSVSFRALAGFTSGKWRRGAGWGKREGVLKQQQVQRETIGWGGRGTGGRWESWCLLRVWSRIEKTRASASQTDVLAAQNNQTLTELTGSGVRKLMQSVKRQLISTSGPRRLLTFPKRVIFISKSAQELTLLKTPILKCIV